MDHICQMVHFDKALINSSYVANKLEQELDITVKRRKLREIMRVDMDLKYAPVRSRQEYVNSHKNILLRQHFAVALSRVMVPNVVFVNFDESKFTDSTSCRHSYMPKYSTKSRTYKKDFLPVHLFMAMFSNGRLIYNFMTGTNNQITFLIHLNN